MTQTVPDRVAREVAVASQLGLQKIGNVASLQQAFHQDGHAASFAGLEALLGERGVCITKVPLDCGRNGGVALTAHPPERARKSGPAVAAEFRADVWKPGYPPEPLDASSSRALAVDEVLWCHVTLGPHDPDTTEVLVTQVLHHLASWPLGVDREMVRDLVTPDTQPKVDIYGDEASGVRQVSTLAVVARELEDDDDDLDGTDEQLIFQLVEHLVSRNWIISCWHPGRLVNGRAARESDSQPFALLQEPFMTQVRRQWEAPDSTLRTAGDLGLALAGEMSHTYTESLRMIERWVQSTEVQFFDRLSGDDTNIDSAAAEIRSMLAITGEFRTSLTAFQHARLVTSDRSWFPDVTQSDADGDGGAAAAALTQTIQGGQDKLDSIFAAIRADMDLLMLQSMGRQQRAAEDQQRTSIELQDKLAKVTALLLVPTLIAGIFGANTMLPGEQRWWGFGLMVVLMLASSVIVYLSIRPGSGPRNAAPAEGE